MSSSIIKWVCAPIWLISIVFIGFALLVSGCTTVHDLKLMGKMEPPSYCEPGAKSYVVDAANTLGINTSKLAEHFVAINTTGLRFAPEGALRGMHGALDNMEKLLKQEPRPTYFEFGVMFIQNQKYMNSYTGTIVMTVGKLVLDLIGINKPIEDCDAMQFLDLIDMERKSLPAITTSESACAEGESAWSFLSCLQPTGLKRRLQGPIGLGVLWLPVKSGFPMGVSEDGQPCG